MKVKLVFPQTALFQLGFKQTIKGAAILGILIGIMAALQGFGYVKTYPDAASRAAFAAAFESAPALGVLYGEIKNLASGAGYMVYRTVPVMGLLAAIWALMTVTKLLRGQEEDGRWEVLTSASTTPRQATFYLFAGFSASLIVAFTLSTIIVAAIGSMPEIAASIEESVLIGLSIFLPALLFGGIGILVSQLAATRRRAIFYGLTCIALFFILRSIANIIPDLYWLKTLTPFGWADQISPIFDPAPLWASPFLFTVSLFIVGGTFLVGTRDLGSGIINESATRKPRFHLLKSATGLAFRQNIPLFAAWTIAAISISILMASLTNVATEAVTDSPSLAGIVSQLGDSTTSLKLAFIGAGSIFVIIALLIMTTASFANIRKDEAKDYLDILLAQPLHRSSWLGKRLLLIIAASITVSLAHAVTTWLMADFQNITLDLGNMLLIAITATGIIIFTLGLGTLLYGIAPRIAVTCMYIVIAWSFLIDILESVIGLNEIIVKSSLFHYVTLSPAATPDWATFAWLIAIGFSMGGIGILAFTKRDIISE